jgi:hypothetical protein
MLLVNNPDRDHLRAYVSSCVGRDADSARHHCTAEGKEQVWCRDADSARHAADERRGHAEQEAERHEAGAECSTRVSSL